MTNIYQMPADAKVWIYQADREFDAYEAVSIRQKLQSFVREWTSHGRDVKAWADLLHNRFLVFMADEKDFQVSGCSIDKSVKFVKELEGLFAVNLFDRFNVAWKEGEEVKGAGKDQFSAKVKAGEVTEDTIVFNNLVSTKEEFESRWQVPLKESWHKRVFF